VQLTHIETVRQLLRLIEVVDGHEGVVDELVAEASLVQGSRESMVSVEVELQTKRAPGGHAQVAQPVLRVDEVEVVVDALARVRLQEGLVRVLVMPRLVRLARLHRAQDAYQAGGVTALGKKLFHDRLLADLVGAQKLDLDAVFLRKPLGVGAGLIP